MNSRRPKLHEIVILISFGHLYGADAMERLQKPRTVTRQREAFLVRIQIVSA
jgi:hypothetical protein